MDFIDRLLGPRGAARRCERAVQALCAAVMFLLAWLVWLKADRIWAYRRRHRRAAHRLRPVRLLHGGHDRARRRRSTSTRSRGRAPMIEGLVGLAADDGAAPSCACPSRFAMGIVGIVGYAYMRDWNWSGRLRHRPDQDLRDRPQLHAVGGAAVHPDGQLRHARRHVAGAVPRRLRLHRPPARRPGHGHDRGPAPASAAICGSSIATAATFAKVAYPSMKRFGYSDRARRRRDGRRRHARHHDPAVDHHGDLRHLHRDQHRQAVRRRRSCPGILGAILLCGAVAVHDLARSGLGAARRALELARAARSRSRTSGRSRRCSCS